MATIPAVPTEVPGNFWTSALWNANILGGLSYLFSPVRFKAYSATVQSLATGTTPVMLLLDTNVVDSDGGHSTVTNTSRYVVQTAGLYFASAFSYFGGTTGVGSRSVQLFANGSTVIGAGVQTAASAANGTSVYVAAVAQLAVGDYVETGVWQNSGATVSTSVALSAVTTMSLYRISS